MRLLSASWRAHEHPARQLTATCLGRATTGSKPSLPIHTHLLECVAGRHRELRGGAVEGKRRDGGGVARNLRVERKEAGTSV